MHTHHLVLASLCISTAACSAILDIGSFSDQLPQTPEDSDPVVPDGEGGSTPDETRTGDLLWSQAFGATADDMAAGLAADEDGLTIGGTIHGVVTFGSDTIGEVNRTQVFVTRLDPDGVALAAVSTMGTGGPVVHGMAVSGSRSVAIVGTKNKGTLGFTDMVQIPDVPGDDNADAFAITLDESLNQVGILSIKGNSQQRALAVAPHGSGFIVVGDFQGNATFEDINPTPEPQNASATSRAGFALKMNANGKIAWLQTFDGSGLDSVTAVVVDGDTAYIAGSYDGSEPISGLGDAGGGVQDLFFAALNAANMGSVTNAVRFGETGGASVDAIVFRDGSIAATGSFTRSYNFEVEMLISGVNENAPQGTGTSPDTMADVFVLMLDDGLAPQWAKRFGSRDGDDTGHAIAIDSAGDVVAAGSISGRVPFADVTTYESNGNADAFVLKLDSATGDVVWVHGFGRGDSDHVFGVAIDDNDEIVTAGDFREGFLIDDTLTKSVGSGDIFVNRFMP